MSVSSLLSRIDDWINPIVVKELRQAVKSRLVVGILMVFLGLQIVSLGIYLLVHEMSADHDAINWNAGVSVFVWQQGILLWTLMLFVPAYAAIRLGAERSDHNVDLLFISTLNPRSIIAGKFFAALVLALLVYSTCAPFMTFTYLLRGIDIPTILTVLGIDLLAMLFSTMVALFLASVPGPRVGKIFLGFVGLFFLVIVCWSLTAAITEMVDTGLIVFERYEMWLVLAIAVASVLGLVGLLFFYAVALISPISSNRILPVRVYLFVLWMVMAIGLFLTSYHFPGGLHLGPVSFLVFAASVLICVQFLISICERERWGPRMTRSIPRHLLPRFLAFLFYTGSAGGVLLTVFMATATLMGAWMWCEVFGTTGPGRGWEPATVMLAAMIPICLYTFCYGLSAVFVRTYILKRHLKPAFTWLLGLLLVGLGSSIPAVLAYIFFSHQMRYGTDSGWWMLLNPFMAVYELVPRYRGTWNEEFQTLCYLFLTGWALLMTALSVPWFGAQLRRFQPAPKKLKVEHAPVLVEAPAAHGSRSEESGVRDQESGERYESRGAAAGPP
jgi:hypothetical protein